MAYVDHAFSISDEDLMLDTPYALNNRPPFKEIALALALLVFGTLGIISGIFMACNRVGGDRAHGLFFALLGCVLFIPGFYYTRIAYYAYKGVQRLLLFQHSPGLVARATALLLSAPMYSSFSLHNSTFVCYLLIFEL